MPPRPSPPSRRPCTQQPVEESRSRSWPEQHDDNSAYTGVGTPFPGVTSHSAAPASQPALSRSCPRRKIFVIDDRIALVGSANFTSRAMDTNLECGILVCGERQPHAIREHLTELIARGYLRRA
jgi:hypothetical protein